MLRPREAFDWSGKKISFSIPPAGWRRERETSGGIKGARFVKERSVGEAIGLGDYYILADRNRSARALSGRFVTRPRSPIALLRSGGYRRLTIRGADSRLVDRAQAIRMSTCPLWRV